MRLILFAGLLALGISLSAAPEYPKLGPDIYDTEADGTKQIENAIVRARSEHKHVLLKLGANWCSWCRKLSHTFETDPAVSKLLRQKFVLVLVDVNSREGKNRNADVNQRYGNPVQHGLPVLLVLDGQGHLLATQETGALEKGDAHDPGKIIAFLQKHLPPE